MNHSVFKQVNLTRRIIVCANILREVELKNRLNFQPKIVPGESVEQIWCMKSLINFSTLLFLGTNREELDDEAGT